MEKGQDVRTHFKTPEGRYSLHSAKTAGTVASQMRRPTRLTVAALHGGPEEGLYMVFNIGELLHVTPFDATDKACWACVCVCACVVGWCFASDAVCARVCAAAAVAAAAAD